MIEVIEEHFKLCVKIKSTLPNKEGEIDDTADVRTERNYSKF